MQNKEAVLVDNDQDYSLLLERFYMNYKYLTEERNGQQLYSITDQCYAASNENLKEVFAHILSKNKTISKAAVVGSSGDQLLNCLYKGVKDVTLIDKNPMAEAVTELKLSALKNLNYIEFMNFWNMHKVLDYKLYQKLSYSLSDKAKMFWDNIMLEMQPSNGYDILDSIFQRDSFWCKGYDVRGSEFYKRRFKYNRMQKILNKNDYKITYIVSDLEGFSDNLKGKYDLIMLSNIFDYVDTTPFFEVINKFKDNNLEEGGVVQILYDFDRSTYFPFVSSFKDMVDEFIDKDNVYSRWVPDATYSIFNKSQCKNWLYVNNKEDKEIEQI